MDDNAIAEPVETTEPAPAAEGEGAAPAQQSDTFFDASQLAPELQGQWKNMQAAYTKKMQKLAGAREAASIVDRFNTDPDFARQTILQRAQQLGIPLGHPGQQPGIPGGQSTSRVPPELVEAVKANLSPELQWMAPALASSQWAGMQMALQPIQQQQAQTMRQTRDQQFDELAEALAQKAPGWEEHEDDMDALLGFLQSDKMTDRRWGSKLELLHRLVTGEGQATANAARRMADAARHRNPAGQPVATPGPDVSEAVRKPKTTQDAFNVAAQFALGEMRRQGLKV